MTTVRLTPTKSHRDIILHRLSCADCISEVFADTDGLEHLAEPAYSECVELGNQLWMKNYLEIDPNSELHREIIKEVIEGNTWIATVTSFNFPNSPAEVGARRALNNVAKYLTKETGIEFDYIPE